jgi:hypothetical protein
MMLDFLPVEARERVLATGAGLGATLLIPLLAEVQSLGEKSIVGVIIMGLSVFFGKYLASKPHIIAALRESRASDAELNDKQMQALIDRINAANAREVEVLKDAIDRNVLRGDTAEREAVEERKAKHKATEAVWSLLLHIQYLEETMRRAHPPLEVPVRPNIRMEEWQEGHDKRIADLYDRKAEITATALAKKTSGPVILP